jgi:hypothetical protein
MKSTALAVLLLTLSICASCFAQAEFRFYVFDETKTDKLHYRFVQDIAIYGSGSQDPRLVYYTEYRIYGINQEFFTFTTQRYDGDLSEKAYAGILDRARMLPLAGLKKKTKGKDVIDSSGTIKFDDEYINVKASPDTEVRRQWQRFVDDLLAEYAPAKKRTTTRRTLEGDLVKPREIDFATLLANPKTYDGKRIRLTGYYRGEFESSSFSATEEDNRNYKQALWRGGNSTFANPKRISRRNNLTLTVEGSLDLGRGGHMGVRMGELNRLTKATPVGGR